MRLAIGGPTRDLVPASFAVDVAQLYATTRDAGPWRTVTLGFVAATYIHAGREWFLESTLQQGATHLLWLDTDMTFPPETAIRLAWHDRPIVACNYTTRDGSGDFTAMRKEAGATLPTRIETRADSTGLEAVDAVGMGVMLMRLDVVASLAKPWFVHGLNDNGRQDIGEDIMFCRALRAAGHTIYIDHDLSKEIGHVGLYTYRAIESQSAVA